MLEIKPGRYDNITIEQYHKDYPGWSKTALDKVNRSMAHYLAYLDKKEESEALSLGAAFHCAILTPHLFEKEFAVIPECDRRKKEGKELWAEFMAENACKKFITIEQNIAIKPMVDAVMNHPVAGGIFTAGDAEHSFFWTDKNSHLLCKCRPDYLRRDGIIIELKTTKNAEFSEFQRSIAKYRYHVQGAYFLDGVNANSEVKYDSFLIVAVESEEPYAVAVYKLDQDAIERGRNEYKADHRKIVDYFGAPESERWAGYSPVVQDMFLPAWV